MSDNYNFVIGVALEALKPDLDLTVDKWSDQHMIIPKSSGSNEYGPYRTQRTPHARRVMLALSDDHPCKRVVCMVASQMFKTQVALNWFSSTVHQSPSNFLWLMPTGKLHKRIAARIDKTIAAVPVLTERVAKRNSRDSQNNQDTKEYIGGALFIATAGAAANLSEVPARRVAFDEIDRAEMDVDGEGDPVKLAENRQTTFKHNKKSYYYSSPTFKGESRIEDLYTLGTQRRALAECIHCGHAQELIYENLILSDDGKQALYPCVECGGIHKESDKNAMFKNGVWSDGVAGDDETESFSASAMFLPYGWVSWRDLMREYDSAKKALDAGNDEFMKVFYNTRLARCWDIQKEQTAAATLMDRAEQYKLETVPSAGLVLTAAIDTQADRLEIKVIAWGEGLECWVIGYYIILGDPSEDQTFDKALEVLGKSFPHELGGQAKIDCTFIDSGGLNTQDVYNFTMKNKDRNIFAVKGSSNPFHLIIAGKPTKVSLNRNGVYKKKAVDLWNIGTVSAKDYLYARWKREKGPGAIHFSSQLPAEYFDQLVVEYRVTRFHRGRKTHGWEKKKHDRNEALDLMVYNLGAAYKLELNSKPAEFWDEKRESLKRGQSTGGNGNGKISLVKWARK